MPETIENQETDHSPASAPVPVSAEPPAPAGDAQQAPVSAEQMTAPMDAEPASPVAPAASPAPLRPAECGQQLRQLFPSLFGGAAKPLKLRIQVDIQARAPGKFSKQTLSAFFRRHTGSTSYLIAMTKSPTRFDLDGQPAGEITEEHRKVALDELARRRAGQDERRQLEDQQRQLEEQQRRNRAGLLHDFQITTLTKANFCALKGVPEDELDGLLEIARGEANERRMRERESVPRHLPPADRSRRPEGDRSGRGGRGRR